MEYSCCPIDAWGSLKTQILYHKGTPICQALKCLQSRMSQYGVAHKRFSPTHQIYAALKFFARAFRNSIG
jgi:hypothetical protein